MGKEKKHKRKSEGGSGDEEGGSNSKQEWADKTRYLSPISQPLAGRKLTKRLFKVVKKANSIKNLRKGPKEVQRHLRKGEKGVILIAGDVSPIDIISHIPVLSEDLDLPYCFVPSKQDLGGACGSKRQMCLVLIKEHEDYKELYDEIHETVKNLPMPL